VSVRNTTPRNRQLPDWRKENELRMRRQERKLGAPGASYATPFSIGETTINSDNQGELIQMEVFDGDEIRARRGLPIAQVFEGPLTVTSVSTLVDLITVPFATKRDRALIEINGLVQFHTTAPLSDDNLYLVVNFAVDDVDITVAPYWVFSAGVAGFWPKALTYSPFSVALVPFAGSHTAKIRVRKANLGPADDIVLDDGESVLWVSIYEVIG
jgi:hypothetical protein